MEKRRSSNRGRWTRESARKLENKSNLRSSPSRRASPTRKASPSSSSGRKSPARRASPGRKASPARRASPSRRAASPAKRPPSVASSTRSSRQRSAAVITPTPVVPPSPIKEKKEPPATATPPKPKNEKTKTSPQSTTKTTTNDVVNKSPVAITSITTTSSSVHSSFSISTQKTTDIGSSKNTSGESELAKLTDFIRRSVSKTFSTSQRGGSQTPSTHQSRISRSISQSNYDDGDNYSKMEFSDSEEENFKSVNITLKSSYTPLIDRTSTSFCRKIEAPKEFGGLVGSCMLLVIVPLLAYYLPWCCRKKVCEFKQPNLSALFDLKYVEKIFNGQAVGSYVAFNSGIFILSAALFGRFVRLPSDRPGSGYYFNALPIAVLATIGLGVGEYLKYPVADFILKNYLRYSLFSLLNAFFVATWCYVRANYIGAPDLQTNPYAKSGNFIVDFCLGKQVNPKWFGSVDIKQVYYKVWMITTLLFAEIFILKNIELPSMPAEIIQETETLVGSVPIIAKFYAENIKFDTTSLVSSLMLLTYALDGAIFEHHLASSFELQQEGLGALVLIRYAATPFLLNAIPKYLFEHKSVVLPNWAMAVMVILFAAGLVLKRISNKIKYQYRINPNLPAFNQMETIHTFQGRRLLLGNLWGRVRQPNYAGEILTLLSFTVPLCFKFAWPPLVCILLFVVFLLHRSVRLSARNSTRYHSSWVRYCMKVRNLVVPKVF
ncbi:lamin-B receptor [Eupeodes corollae]|uniref:lamin-B receptor n=1 Tax=Eupeodes corollae TaxID=290404 RepID=UPI002490F8E5|nr:lamin-B receptor [Eupeodes corollae]